jgi:spartin
MSFSAFLTRTLPTNPYFTRYGKQAGDSTRLMTGAVRNVALVYIDVRGLGHRALLKTAGVEVVKTRLRDGREVRLQTEGSQVVGAQVEGGPISEKRVR